MLARTEPCAGVAGGAGAALSGPGGPALIVRAVTDADVEGLDALFRGLPGKDLYHRFFHFCHPARGFLERLTRAADEGGYRLVAAVSGAGGALVAEAGYVPLPDGDGEFALTVAPAWQGRRLGRRLLGALVAAAAARGVPNLQADIMAGNAQMLALLRRHGYMTLAREELSEMRIAIGAAQPARRRPPGNADPLGPLVPGTGASCTPAA